MNNVSKYRMLQIILNLYSTEQYSGLYYHSKPRLCNAMREFKIPWHIGAHNRVFFNDMASIEEILADDDPLLRGYITSIAGQIRNSNRLTKEDKKLLLDYAGLPLRRRGMKLMPSYMDSVN